jgi:hypothetical protein
MAKAHLTREQVEEKLKNPRLSPVLRSVYQRILGDFPYVDPDVRHVGVSYLRKLSAEVLTQNPETLVIQNGDHPVAVLLPYSTYMAM